MSPAPGTDVQIKEAPRTRSNPTDTGQGLMLCECERGPSTPFPARSLTEWVTLAGARQSFSPGYDAAEAFFREGGSTLWTSRVVADGATTAKVDLSDGVNPTLRVSANGVGPFANGWRVIVLTNADDASIAVGSFRLRVTDAAGAVLVESPTVEDKTQALAWSAGLAQLGVPTVVLSDLAGANDPVRVVAPGTAFAGGADDRANITQAEWDEALARLNPDLGPGQVFAPGRTTTAMHLSLTAHAARSARRRHAILDLPDSPTPSVVIAAARAADNIDGRWASAYWPPAVAPGLTPFSTRIVPWSAVQAGMAARADAKGNPNVPVAGEHEQNGVARWATDVTQNVRALTEADRQALDDAGVNVVMTFFGGGGPTTYGNRTLRLKAVDPLWAQASGSRCMMAIAAMGDAVLKRYVHTQVDGKGVRTGGLAGEFIGFLGELYELGALYGLNARDAFSVNTGPAVNPPAQVEGGLLKAAVSARVSPGADHVTLELTRVSITEVVA
jgi:hypothetical protein